LPLLHGPATSPPPRTQRIESFLTDVWALADLLDGFVLTVLIVVAIGAIYYAIRLVKELRRGLLDRISDVRGAADQDDRDPVGAGEDPAVEGQMPTINPLFDFLIGVFIGGLVVLVLISMVALVSS
jgi:hypothetical protein